MRNGINDKLSIFLFSLIILTIGYILYAHETGQFEKHKSWVYSVDNNKQDLIISASENELLLWDKRHCTDRLVGHSDAIKTVAFSHSGQLFASGSIDKSIKVWSSSDRKVIQTLKGHTKGVNKVEFSASDNCIVSTGYDGKLYIWDWESGNILQEFNTKHTNFSINKSDVLAYIDTACNLILFDLKSLNLIKVLGQFCGSPVFHPQKNIIALNEINKSIFTFIDITTGKVMSVLNIKKENSASEVSAFKFTPDGYYIVVGIWGGDIEIWDWQQKKLTRTLQGHILSSVEGFAFNSKNELISASGDRSLKIWSLNNGNLKMAIGDGLFQAKLNGLLSIVILLTLISSFGALMKSEEKKFSSFAILSILTGWSLGFLLVLYLFKSKLTKFASAISWTATVLSGLFFLSVWFSWLAIFSVPIALFFCYIQLQSDRQKKGTYLPLLINLIFCGILCSFVTSTGLWE